MRDYYELIGVPENASEAWIERAHRTAREAIDKNALLKPKQRDQACAELDAALATLMDSARRHEYDAKLEAVRAAKAAGGAVVYLKRGLIGLILLAMVGAGVIWYQQREAERERVETEAREADQKAQRLLAEIAAQRAVSEQRMQRETAERKAEEDRRLEEARLLREKELQTQKYVFDDTELKAERARKFDLSFKQQRFDELKKQFGTGMTSWQFKSEAERRRLLAERNEYEQLRVELLHAQEAELRRRSGR